MADEAFALSPISARPSPPSEADYEAIREAFAETARGRWFLNEYTRRNRNADTSMVLDAVARIEATIAARTQPAPADQTESFDTINAWIADARVEATSALASGDRDAALVSARKGARVIREISWSLRETGTDPRICNILDAQLQAIEALYPFADDDGRRDAIAAVFDSLLAQIRSLTGEDAGTGTVDATQSSFEAPVTQEPVHARASVSDDIASPLDADTAQSASVETASANSFDESDIAFALVPTEDDLAEDDAVLGRIALEMSAPDETHHDADDLENADADIIALKTLAPDVTEAAADHTPSLQPSLPPSLGAALLANGIVRAPTPSGVDPFAPIRRMSQAEKMAFFS